MRRPLTDVSGRLIFGARLGALARPCERQARRTSCSKRSPILTPKDTFSARRAGVVAILTVVADADEGTRFAVG